MIKIMQTSAMRRGLVLVLMAVSVLAACAIAVLLVFRESPPDGAPSLLPLIVLDAGHGGRDPGAIYEGIHEADINLAVMSRIASLIKADERLELRQTRTLDITVSLEDRIAVANNSDAPLYLSIQSNASPYTEASGIETLVSDQVASNAPAWQFAEILQDAVTDVTSARDRGVRAQELYLHSAKMPAALIEVGFLTNNTERAKLLDADYQDQIAQGIYDGIVNYLSYADPRFPEE
jgi:N-acetylmuramoyl-L-alanine amidase